MMRHVQYIDDVISAAGTGDYASISQPLTFSPGSGFQQRCANITILDDNVVESVENFFVSLETSVSDADHVDFNVSDTAVVNITDDDSKCYLSITWYILMSSYYLSLFVVVGIRFEQTTYFYLESAGLSMVCALLEGEADREIAVTFGLTSDVAQGLFLHTRNVDQTFSPRP